MMTRMTLCDYFHPPRAGNTPAGGRRSVRDKPSNWDGIYLRSSLDASRLALRESIEFCRNKLFHTRPFRIGAFRSQNLLFKQ